MHFIKHQTSKNLITYLDINSPIAEAYRRLRTNITYFSAYKHVKTLIVTSPSIQDGKTTTACNLAVCMAQSGKNVLIIDSDFRKPKIHKCFKISNDYGLAKLLVDQTKFEDVVKTIDDIPNLSILTSGILPPNPSEILSSTRAKEMIRDFENKFDFVVIDTPPILQVSDATVIATYTDGVILTVAAGETNIEHAKIAKKSLENVNAKIMGVVMTKININKRGYHYKQGY